MCDQNTPICFKHLPDKTDPVAPPSQQSREESQEDEVFDRGILCAACGHLITHGNEEISINGAHRHVFANPYGLVFETACYKKAMGCVVTGQPSDEFTWFPGYRWQIAHCRGCFNHLGWRFSSASNVFFCLISHQLI
ncbi:hypothetical protein SAMN02746065_12513 [Desulfocicer vacuolatum DSM 3385]|uniref:CULT domain-containing protein n=1 Tax=Desulfocicer vacuolatum DSM 3385 TaxID=1121400 RepID=A0A1W2E6I2_9BACT|nr:cereblon family protein [Desulfocicer vacuolatum]SMD05117.1 hypothetical protein SAMN02746065_12513 [Desulfocicer vacuolatum DSM 3385]